ncbi:hypothetical protein ONZ45_g13586 [Pleurotus djamor]|nr:hypothetical protein ONZ45_g13586 [Pleurotus djamor]
MTLWHEFPRNANPAFALLGLLLGTLLYGAILVQVRVNQLRSVLSALPPYWYRYSHIFTLIEFEKTEYGFASWFVAFKALSSRFSSVAQVGYLVLMETGMIAFNMWAMYYTMDSMFNKLANSPRDVLSDFGVIPTWDFVLRTNTILTVFISTPVQCSMAWRLRVIARSVAFPAFIVFLSLVSFGLGVATLVIGDRLIMNDNTELGEQGANSFSTPFSWLITSAVADSVIAICFIITLSRKRTGIKSTDTILIRLTHLLVGTGAITALLTVLDAGLYYRGAETLFVDIPFVYVIPEMIISKLYTNSLLATLNARIVWRDYLPKPESVAAKGWSSLPSIKIVQKKVTVTSDSSS